MTVLGQILATTSRSRRCAHLSVRSFALFATPASSSPLSHLHKSATSNHPPPPDPLRVRLRRLIHSLPPPLPSNLQRPHRRHRHVPRRPPRLPLCARPARRRRGLLLRDRHPQPHTRRRQERRQPPTRWRDQRRVGDDLREEGWSCPARGEGFDKEDVGREGRGA